jgi:adenylate cyclase
MEISRPRATILVFSEDRPETVIELPDILSIGRSSANDLVVNHQRASRKHSEIRHVGQSVYKIVDIGSRNGTWVNGQRITSPRTLEDGDQIQIGGTILHFIQPASQGEDLSDASQSTRTMPTMMAMRRETVIVLVSDIRNYTWMTENLPAEKFQLLVADWFREHIDIIERNSGIVDKLIGDAVLAYWIVKDAGDPSDEVTSTLRSATQVVELSGAYSRKLRDQFDFGDFRVGIGINMGEASIGNVGTGSHQSFTVVGDCVNVAFRLESLTKEKNRPIVLNREVAQWASTTIAFEDLGETRVKGRDEPIAILALNI